MIRRNFILLLTMSFFVISCIHSSKNFNANYKTSLGRSISSAGAESELSVFAKESAFNLNSQNLVVFNNEKNEVIDCSKVTTRIETFNGKSYTKFNISKADFLSCPQVRILKSPRVWKVKKLTWTKDDESLYQKFIQAMAKSGCNTAEKCLSGPSNILRTEEDLLNNFYIDCADFPYYLRSYFAYKNNLPMSFVLEIAQNPFSEAHLADLAKKRADEFVSNGEAGALAADKNAADLRYSIDGNRPISRFSIPGTKPRANDFGTVAPQIVNIISSGFMRMTSAPENSVVQTDFYSPKIILDNIKPGTVLYSVAGHVAVVYDVTAMGEVLFMDAHPDNSISRGKFNLSYRVVRSAYGGNFKNFRPFEVTNPSYDTEGNIITGSIKVAKDSEIPQFSLEQYNGDGVGLDGNGIYKLKPSDKKTSDFQEWVKYRLSNGAYRLDPVVEMKNEVDSLCLVVQDRAISVQVGVESGISNLPHPENLPPNIYGADGAWESYSSPGSDFRLRERILTIPNFAKSWITRYKAQDRLIRYPGSNIKGDLILSYQAAANSCKISYKNSAGVTNTVSLDKIINRVATLSYDPYMCPEIRWGATSAEELSTCKDDFTKKEWQIGRAHV